MVRGTLFSVFQSAEPQSQQGPESAQNVSKHTHIHEQYEFDDFRTLREFEKKKVSSQPLAVVTPDKGISQIIL